MENNMEEPLSQDLPQALEGSKLHFLARLLCVFVSTWYIRLCSERGASHEIAVQQ